MFVTIAAALYMIYYRWNDLKSDNQLESFLSRESTFLFEQRDPPGPCLCNPLGDHVPIDIGDGHR